MKPWITIIGTALVASCAAQAGGQLNAGDVKAALAHAPGAALSRYFDCSKYEGTAYEAIAGGAAPWIAVAEQALARADACQAEGIVDALGRAMQRAPETVLPLVGKSRELSAERICLPSISDEIPLTAQREQVRRSRVAIQAASGLPRQKAACLRFIAPIEARLGTRR